MLWGYNHGHWRKVANPRRVISPVFSTNSGCGIMAAGRKKSVELFLGTCTEDCNGMELKGDYRDRFISVTGRWWRSPRFIKGKWNLLWITDDSLALIRHPLATKTLLGLFPGLEGLSLPFHMACCFISFSPWLDANSSLKILVNSKADTQMDIIFCLSIQFMSP